jgi:hypothetical protein
MRNLVVRDPSLLFDAATMLFKAPGPEQLRPNLKEDQGYETIIVDQRDVEKYVENGWSLTPATAVEIMNEGKLTLKKKARGS